MLDRNKFCVALEIYDCENDLMDKYYNSMLCFALDEYHIGPNLRIIDFSFHKSTNFNP